MAGYGELCPQGCVLLALTPPLPGSQYSPQALLPGPLASPPKPLGRMLIAYLAQESFQVVKSFVEITFYVDFQHITGIKAGLVWCQPEWGNQGTLSLPLLGSSQSHCKEPWSLKECTLKTPNFCRGSPAVSLTCSRSSRASRPEAKPGCGMCPPVTEEPHLVRCPTQMPRQCQCPKPYLCRGSSPPLPAAPRL